MREIYIKPRKGSWVPTLIVIFCNVSQNCNINQAMPLEFAIGQKGGSSEEALT